MLINLDILLDTKMTVKRCLNSLTLFLFLRGLGDGLGDRVGDRMLAITEYKGARTCFKLGHFGETTTQSTYQHFIQVCLTQYYNIMLCYVLEDYRFDTILIQSYHNIKAFTYWISKQIDSVITARKQLTL